MTVTIQDAVRALEDRKIAAAKEAPVVESDLIPLVVLGLDIDCDEMARVSTLLAYAFLEQGWDAPKALRSCWQDGYLSGILHAHLRAEKESE